MKAVLAVFLLGAGSASGQTSQEFFGALRDSGGVHPFAELVCFPAVGQGLDTTFSLVAFSQDVAATLRARGKSVPKEFIDAEKAPEKDRYLLQWVFLNGVQLHKEPEFLDAVVGSSGMTWESGEQPAEAGKHMKLRVVFSVVGGYSREVVVDGTTTKAVYGRCRSLE